MPATQHEVNTVRAEGLTMLELLAPISFDGATLHCEKMRLGPTSTRAPQHGRGHRHEFVDLPFDTVIGATGATIDTEPYERNGIALDERGQARPRREIPVERSMACTSSATVAWAPAASCTPSRTRRPQSGRS